MFSLIKNGEVFAPKPSGRKDILAVGEKIVSVRDKIDLPAWLGPVTEVDASGHYVVPGFIDQHVHIAGGGGEGGPVTRTPEITLSTLTTAGITTVVGLLGVDGITRSVAGLLAKARALETEGITSYIFTGAYEIPTRTFTGSIRSDLFLIDKVIGVGEIAISDHRSVQPTPEMLSVLASEARVGGLLGNKPGIVHLHVGEGNQGLNPLFEVISNTDIPVAQFVPTHINRLSGLFEEAAEFLKSGGYIDLTAGITPDNSSPGSVEVYEAVGRLANKGLDLSRVTVSSDGNGSMPQFDMNGNLTAVGIGSVKVLWNDVQKVVNENILPLQTAITLITSNVAAVLRLSPRKGVITEGSDADIVILDRNLRIKTVMARGKIMVENEKPVARGYFE